MITTNYDLNLESVIADDQLWHQSNQKMQFCYPGVTETPNEKFVSYDGRATGLGDTGCIPSIEIVKLDGSVNWFSESNRVTIESSPNNVTDENTQICDWDCQAPNYPGAQPIGSPLIIAPVLDKTSTHPQIRAQWKAAMEAITYARELVIVGYSFPETDAFMNRLLAEGVRENECLNRIYIINLDGRDSWWERVQSMFAKSQWSHAVHSFVGNFADFAFLLQRHGGERNDHQELLNVFRGEIKRQDAIIALQERKKG